MRNENFVKEFFLDGERILASPLGETNGVFYWSILRVKDKYNVAAVIKTNEALDILSIKSFEIDGFSTRISSLEVSSSGQLYFVGHIARLGYESILCFKTNQNLDISWKKEYDNFDNFRIYNRFKIRRLNDNLYAIQNSDLIFTINENGEILNSLRIGDRAHYDWLFEHMEVISGKIILIGNSYIQNDSGLGSINNPGIFRLLTLNPELEKLGELEYFSSNQVNDEFIGNISNVSTIVSDQNELYISVIIKEKNYLLKIDSLSTLPLSINAIYFEHNLFSTNYSSLHNIFYFDNHLYQVIFANSSESFHLLCFDQNLNLNWIKTVDNFEMSRLGISERDNLIIHDNKIFLTHYNYQHSTKVFKTNINLSDNTCYQSIPNKFTPIFEAELLTGDQRSVQREELISVSLESTNIGNNFDQNVNFQIVQTCPDIPILAQSEITAEPIIIASNGISESLITVQLKDESGNPIDQGEFDVVIKSSIGSIVDLQNDHSQGIYTAKLNSTEPGKAFVTFSVGGEMSIKTAIVSISGSVASENNAISQSPHIYLQAAGSTGADGTVVGNHLRWAFRNKLGNQHFPKGNYATTEVNFNKPDDFVKIYRTPYIKNQITVDLITPPQLIDSANRLWLYEVNGNKYHVHFRNAVQFDTVRESINPLDNPTGFLQQYGANLIEVESRNQLAFSVEISHFGLGTNTGVKTELLAVDENKLSALKKLIARKTFITGQLANTYQVAENIKSIRFIPTDTIVSAVKFELYSDHVATANESLAWLSIGDFALTKDDDVAYERLEQEADTINGSWPRFTDQALTNIDNYKDRWNGPREVDDRSLKDLVTNYIQLSDAANPKSLEVFEVDNPTGDDSLNDSIELSNFDLLYINSIDYHNARMLGLGTIDAFAEDQKFIYLAEYHTNGNLGDGLGARPVQHLYASLPTGKSDQRLPLPVDLQSITPGVPAKDRNAALTNPDGYTPDGKKRFLSLYTSEIPEYDNQSFYESFEEFNESDHTTPVFAGISYKEASETNWRQPEISSNQLYLNTPIAAGETGMAETTPLTIPDPGEALFVHRETESGTHIYKTYGINWFSRIQYSAIERSIETAFQPANQLLPPTITNALHVVEETPLILTSQQEQVMLTNNDNTDKTIVRLLIEYDLSHEVINRKITPEEDLPLDQLLLSDTIFPDADEVFANEIELFFRDRTPQNIQGKVTAVNDHPDEEILTVLTLADYKIYSTGETIRPLLPPGIETTNFTGGVFVYDEEQYIIYGMEADTFNRVNSITLYKKQIGVQDQVSTEPDPEEGLKSPEAKHDVIFMAIENMANVTNWGSGVPSSLKINIDGNSIHREVIYKEGIDDQPDKMLTKFRGLYDQQTVVSEVDQFDETLDTTLHKGLYKIEFAEPLAHHSQYKESASSVDWYGGLIHIHTQNDPTGARRPLKVVKLEGVGTTDPLAVYAIDETFQPVEEAGSIVRYESENPIQTGANVSSNLYAGYKVYLYAEPDFGLTKTALTPAKGAGVKYSIFGARTVDENYSLDGNVYKSGMSTPAIMFTQEITEPVTPALPEGPTFATRPDSFGKATYTLANVFTNEPYALVYQRSDNEAILNAIYKSATVRFIKEQISQLTTAAYETSRWKNLLSFEYLYESDDPFNTNGNFGQYPPFEDGFRLPNPDGNTLFQLINADREKFHLETGGDIEDFVAIEAGSLTLFETIISGGGEGVDTTLTDYVRQIIMNTFVPLTEVPLLFDQVDETQPSNRKQNVRDRNGALLPPEHPDFDVAPMAKTINSRSGSKVLFTDFTLDGTSDNFYFYSLREMGTTMQLSDYSPVLGPVKLLNTKPPKAPEIVDAITVLAQEDYTLKEESISFTDLVNVEVTGNTLTKTSPDGWDGGAASVQIMEGDFEISFQLSDAMPAMVGVSAYNQGHDVESIHYGLELNEANELLYRNKEGNQGVISDYIDQPMLRIAKKGNQLIFMKSGLTIQTEEVEMDVSFLIDIALKAEGAVVSNMNLTVKDRYHQGERSSGLYLPLTFSDLENIVISDGGIEKTDPLSEIPSSGLMSKVIPNNGAIHYQVSENSDISVSITDDQLTSENTFTLACKNDGFLYAYQNGTELAKCIPYKENSMLMIEKTSSAIHFKHNDRIFYVFEDIPTTDLVVRFSLDSVESKISKFQLMETWQAEKSHNRLESTGTAMQFEINAYQSYENIGRINLYRTTDPANSLSIRKMELVASKIVTKTDQVDSNVWSIKDRFHDLPDNPFGEPLYYRVSVDKLLTYSGENGDLFNEYIPSLPSKLMVSTVEDVSVPDAPELFFSYNQSADDMTQLDLRLVWKKTVHNGYYHVYKLNNQGNWIKIHTMSSNEQTVEMPLSDTILTEEEIYSIDPTSTEVYHHFRVDAENSSGMISEESEQISIPGERKYSEEFD